MTAIQQAAELYAKNGQVLASDLTMYLKHGYVDVSPDRLILFRPYSREKGVEHWLEDFGQADAWFIGLAVGGGGCLKKFLQLMPYYLPFVSWRRAFKNPKDQLHVYPTEKIINYLGD